MTERRKLKSFLLFCGYVEEQSLAAFPLHHNEGFDHPLDMLEHLQKLLAACWKMRNPPMGCCERAQEAEANYCSVCGRRVPDNQRRENQELNGAEELFRELFTSVNDGTGDVWEYFDANGWQWGGLGEPEWLTTMVGVDSWLEDEGWCEAYMPDKTDWNSREDREGNPAS